MTIHYFGAPYSFAHVAGLKRYGKKHKYISHGTVKQVFDACRKDNKAIGIVPTENSCCGEITETIDELILESRY